MRQRPDRLDTCLTTGIFLAALGFFWLFRRLGWFPQDEGVLYYQYLRTYQGQIPYRDFSTGYAPLTYYLHAWIFDWFGVSMQAVRATMAVFNAASAAGLYAITRRLAPRGSALIPPALFLVMQPGDITDMSFHNSPYPSWYAVTFAVLGCWAMMRSLEAGREARGRAWIVFAGFLGGLTFLSKQNAGIFFLWGATGLLASRPDPPPAVGEREPSLGRVARAAYLALIPLASLFLVKNFVGPATFLAFVAPLAMLAWFGTRRVFGAASLRRLAVRFACLAAGFAAAFGPWLVYFAGKVGLGTFLHDLFFIGTDVDRNLYIPLPLPGVATLVILTPLLLWLLLARSRGNEDRRTQAFGALVTFAFVAGAVLSQADAIADLTALQFGPGEICIVASRAIDNLALYLSLLVLAVALLLARRQARGDCREGDPPADMLLCGLWFSATSFLLLYPRMDAAHLVSAASLLYPVGAALLPRARTAFARSFTEEHRATARRAFSALCLLAVFFVVGVKTAPKLYSVRMFKRTDGHVRIVSTPRIWLGLDRADLYFPVYLDAQRKPIETFREVVRVIQKTTPPGEPIFTFPALSLLYFVSARDNPTRQDYFLGNNVTYREQLDVIRALEKSRVNTVVITNDPGDYFVIKGQDFTRLIREYLRRNYYLDRRIGWYDVLRRYDAPRVAAGARDAR